VGTDISEGMIKQASEEYQNISFVKIAAADMKYEETFDAVFCNSTFQWFREPARPLDAMVRALKPGGKIAIACPATERWSGCFNDVAEKAGSQDDTRDVFKHWRSPWLWLKDEEEYRILFIEHGLEISHLHIEKERSYYTPEQAFSNFISGAAQGFTGKDYYDVLLPDGYLERFKKHAKEAMFSRVKDGRVEVDFQRLYFIGGKR
jgi:trans-aconitate methyltransferase